MFTRVIGYLNSLRKYRVARITTGTSRTISNMISVLI
nr:MAG TPA: hypothetical protein [Caudoviricetes sp.]